MYALRSSSILRISALCVYVICHYFYVHNVDNVIYIGLWLNVRLVKHQKYLKKAECRFCNCIAIVVVNNTRSQHTY